MPRSLGSLGSLGSACRGAALVGTALSLAAAAAVAAAASATAQSLPRIPFEQYTLPNGLDVVLHQDHSVPLVAVDLWYHVGSADERPGRTGLAHLFEHVMFTGSAHASAALLGA